ncbi:MAG: DUF2812 domain-containing protein [Oscillospiraceae bacterium]|jgi:hypothetical protein|nr:DUF2812 domain-containing protein [Oscillospiraceae bacterium]
MKSKIRKVFFDYEKEEKWLNKMAARGLALTDYGFSRYTFEDSAPGEYIYRIELLNNKLTHPESRNYILFMEESGAEVVATWMTWVYFRRKAAAGAFELYSDLDSRIKHYGRMRNTYVALAAAELCILVSQLGLYTAGLSEGLNNWAMFGAAAIALAALVGIFGVLIVRYTKKITRLKRERAIRE